MNRVIPFTDIKRLHELFGVLDDGSLVRIADVPGQRIKAGDKAGCIGSRGRLRVRVDGRHLYVHHIVWAMTHGSWPCGEVDHINGNPLDNRPSNLRIASISQNGFNARTRKDSSSGLKGICFHRQSNSWKVQVSAYRKRHSLHNFKTKELAYDFACLLRFHLHGEFAHD